MADMKLYVYTRRTYSKQQKLHERKILWLNGICHNAAKTFAIHQKSVKTAKVFSRVSFVVTYGTNHPQLKQATRVTRVSQACCLRVTRVLLSWRRRLFSYTRVGAHACTCTNSFTHVCAYMHAHEVPLHAGTFC